MGTEKTFGPVAADSVADLFAGHESRPAFRASAIENNKPRRMPCFVGPPVYNVKITLARDLSEAV